MLYTQTVAPETLELLKRLESEPFMASFSLADETALALYLGHRVSVDLDLFTPETFDEKTTPKAYYISYQIFHFWHSIIIFFAIFASNF